MDTDQKPAGMSGGRLLRVLRAVYCEPWLIVPQMHQTIADIVQAHVSGTAHQAGGIVELFGEPPEAEAPEVTESGVAVLPLRGVLGKRVSDIERSSGACDVDDFAAMVDWARADPSIIGAVLDIDSPGGTVTGTPEAAAAVAALRSVKPVIAYTDTQCASAAYWIASQASAVFTAESAILGSIGIYVPFLDSSRAKEMAGLDVRVFKSGKYKGMGIPGTKLTDEQAAYIQSRVNGVHERFRAAVWAGRPKAGITEETMQGQEFYGADAVAVGLADNVATLADAVRGVEQLASITRGQRT